MSGESPDLETLFRREDKEGLAAIGVMNEFASRLNEDEIRAACERVERAVCELADLLNAETSPQMLALVAGVALQRKELEQCQP